MKVLVTGTYGYHDRERIFVEIDRVHEGAGGPIRLVIVAKDPFDDPYAAQWAAERNVVVAVFWKPSLLTQASGHRIRNQTMVDQRPDIVLAFPGSWAADCVRRAKAAGLTVREIG